jgi:glycosyltransferase involved in cell wall biosynthesis
VVPAYNESENLGRLVEETEASVIGKGIEAELIVVDDGSTDSSADALRELSRGRCWLVPLSLPSRSGQSAALLAGIRRARGRYIATLDADLQNEPGDLPGMLAILERGEADLVQGVRTRRQDTLPRRAASAVGRLARRFILGDRLRDSGCATRILAASIARQVPLQFRGMHRFLPAYARLLGARTVEVPASHRPRQAGAAKYGVLDRALPGLLDCLVMLWMARRYRSADARPIGEGKKE